MYKSKFKVFIMLKKITAITDEEVRSPIYYGALTIISKSTNTELLLMNCNNLKFINTNLKRYI